MFKRQYKQPIPEVRIVTPEWSQILSTVQKHYSLAQISVAFGYSKTYLTGIKRRQGEPGYKIGAFLLLLYLSKK